jgi:putative peptide zinc metalloprotease protein
MKRDLEVSSTDRREEVLHRIQEDQSYKPQRSSHVSLTETVEGDTPFVLTSQITGEYYNIDFFTAGIWKLLDGEHTIRELVDEAKNRYRREVGKIFSKEITDATISETISFLADEGLLAGTEPETSWRRLKLVSAFELDITITRESLQFFKRLGSLFHPVAGTVGLYVTLVLIVLATLVLAPNFLPILFDKMNFEISGSSIVGFFYYYLLLFPILIVHEIAHGATLAYYGGVPGEVGTGLYYFGPMFYVDTSDVWLLPKERRIMVSLAGPLSTLLIGALLLFSNLILPSQILKMMSFFCFYWMLWNLIPLIEVDGYYAIMDFVGIPNLRNEAFSYLKSTLLRKRSSSEEITQKRKVFLAGFALLSVAFMMFMAYDTSIIFLYLASDAFSAFGRILLGMKDELFLADLASLAYFALMTVGYVILPVSLLKRRRQVASDE